MSETAQRRWHSGIAVWAIAVLVGIGAGFLTLALAQRYTDQQRQKAVRVALLRSYKASLAACTRGNVLRSNLNDTTRTQLAFLRTALLARERAVQTAKTRADRVLNEDAAEVYRTLVKHEHLVAIVDCATAFTKP